MIRLMKNEQGKTALNRVGAVGAMIILSVAFIKEAGTNSLEWLDYVGYATGMTISYAPVAAVKLIDAMARLKQMTGETTTLTTTPGGTTTSTTTTPAGQEDAQ
jgi:hypothetical protein